jgi:6-phosphofructokinase
VRFGVLTGGGDCPGLNAVIRAVVRKGVTHYGDSFAGFHDGWRGVLDGDAEDLTLDSTRGILHRGGTILGSSRTNPFKHEDGVDEVLASLKRLQLDGLIAIGGEDTLGAASKLHAAGVPVLGVPKTIDNDLGATDQTFAEGAVPVNGGITELASGTDDFGHVGLGGIGHWLEREIEQRTGLETRATVLGHVQREGARSANPEKSGAET